MDQTDALIEALKAIIEQKDQQIADLRKLTESLQATIVNLNETIEEFRRKFFGVSSEKTPRREETDAGEPPQKVSVRSHTRQRKAKAKREGLYAALPVQKVYCRVPDGERLCPDCGTQMETIGWNYVREELRITPAVVERVFYYQEALACPACREEGEGTIVKGRVPAALLPHSLASPSIVAYVICQKYMDAVPFYRQEMSWLQLGAPLARETMANWCIRCALKYFQPVYERLHAHMLQRDILHADETVCQVLREEGKAATSNSYMWIFTTGNDGLPSITLYEYQPGRQGEHAKNFLEGFSGLLECDGYTGYNCVENVILVCCLAHCRRKFFEAVPAAARRRMKLLDINSEEGIARETADPEEAKAENKTPAEIGLNYCNRLFYIERRLKNLEPEERKAKRLEEEVPIWDSFWAWLESINPVGGSALEKAVNYAANHRELLGNYLLDGRCEISNNRAERCAKAYGTGRKNFLFHTSVDGARSSAILYSLVETAKANRLNVFQYLYVLLLYMPDYKNEPAGIEAMMPWSDFVRERCCGLIDTNTETPEKRGRIPI